MRLNKTQSASKQTREREGSRSLITHSLTAVIFLLIGIGLGAGGYAVFDTDQNATVPTRTVLDTEPTLTVEPRITVDTSGDPAIGAETTAVTMVIFSDFACTFCGHFGRTTWLPLRERYEDRVRFVYRDLPITNQLSMSAALAAECADDQGAFWAYHDRLFADQALLTDEYLLTIAAEMGLNETQFATCITDEIHREEVLADYTDGQALGLSGAPVFFINGRRVDGAQPLLELSSILDEELRAAGQ